MLALEDADARSWTGTTLKVDVEDTLAVRELSLYIRYDGTYAGAPLPLKIYVQAPGGEWSQDNITARFGGAVKGLAEVEVPWRRGVVFPQKGIYTFNITGPEVCGIRAMGIIENEQGQAKKVQ